MNYCKKLCTLELCSFQLVLAALCAQPRGDYRNLDDVDSLANGVLKMTRNRHRVNRLGQLHRKMTEKD